MKQFIRNHGIIVLVISITAIIGITALLTFLMDITSLSNKTSQPKKVDVTKLSKKDGHIYILDIVIDPKGQLTSGITAVITYSQNDLKFIDFRPTLALSDTFVNYNPNTPGIIKLRAVDTQNKTIKNKETIGQIIFQGNLRGNYSIQLSSLQAASTNSILPKDRSPVIFSLVSEIDKIDLALTKDNSTTVNTLVAPTTVPTKISYIDLLNCMKHQKVCNKQMRLQTDLNHDGIINNDDMNIFLKNR